MKAQNRKEIFLKALANGKEPNIKPLTREEVLLKKQAKRESEDSGGGASDVFIVTINDGDEGEVADKTFSEIADAVKSGKMVMAVGIDEGYRPGTVAPLSHFSEGNPEYGSEGCAVFTTVTMTGDENSTQAYVHRFIVNEDNTANHYFNTFKVNTPT